MMASSMRMFVAIGLPPAVQVALAVARQFIQERAQSVGCAQELATSARWVRPEGSHLTLKFLGNVPAEKTQAIGASLAQASAGIAPFPLEVGQIGAFPSLRRARVLWLGLSGDLEALGKLQAAVERELAALGFPVENRPFHPHLTLARLEAGLPDALVRELLASPLTTSPEPLPVNSFRLMRSEIQRGGAKYTSLADLLLEGNGNE
jgi:RNA 2',3'-cyclic 3'-phosphodiesterase